VASGSVSKEGDAPKRENAEAAAHQEKPKNPQPRPKEIGGPKGPEPTRYNDWERKGRCIDF